MSLKSGYQLEPQSSEGLVRVARSAPAMAHSHGWQQEVSTPCQTGLSTELSALPTWKLLSPKQVMWETGKVEAGIWPPVRSHNHHFLNILSALFNEGRDYITACIAAGRNHWEPPCKLATTIYNGVSPGFTYLQVKVTQIYLTSPALAPITN